MEKLLRIAARSKIIQGTRLGRLWAWYLLAAYTIAYTGGALAVTIAAGVDGFGATPYIRAVFLGALGIGATTLCILYLVGGNVRFPKSDFAVSMVLLNLVLLSAAIGLLRDNPLVYIVADVAFILVGLAGYMLTRMGRAIITIDRRSVKRIVLFGLVLAGLTSYGGMEILPSLFLILVAVFASCLFAGDLRSSVISFLPLVILAPSVNRATILTIAVVVAITTAVTAGTGRLRATLKTLYLLAAFSAVLWVGWSFISDTPWFSQSPLGWRIQKSEAVLFGEGGVDTSEDWALGRRLSEAELITENLGTNPLNWVLGMGAGATIDLSSLDIWEPENASLTGEQEVHTIHLLPMAILYRHGLLGLLLLAALVLWLIQTAFRAGDRTTFTAAIAALALIIYSIPASSYVFREPLMWFSLAWMVNSASLQYSIQEWRPSSHRSPTLNTSHMLVSNQAQRSEAVRRVRQQ